MNTTKQFESCSIPVQLQEQIPEEIQEVEQAVPPVSHPKVTVKPMRNKEPEKKKLDETLLQKYRGRESPLYRTNNSIYGAKPVTEVHKHTKWHGANGSFTKVWCDFVVLQNDF